MCLASSNFADGELLYYEKCDANNIYQQFSFTRLEGTQQYMFGFIYSSNRNYCVQISSGGESFILHSNCFDVFELLQYGGIKSVDDNKCLGRGGNSERIMLVPVNCDSENSSIWSSYPIGKYDLFNLHFRTENLASSGPFEIEGIGNIPEECHNTPNAECDVQIYGRNTLTMTADTNDNWRFSITGDIGELIDYKTVDGGEHYPPFPTQMDNTESDSFQIYHLKIHNAENECYNIHFKTTVWKDAASTGTNNFHIDGYGNVPSACYSKLGAECDIKICGRRTLVLRAYTTDEWQFILSGDVDDLREYETV